MEKKVSVIIPLYNGEKYIGRCIESIINQSYKNIEIIVVDDNSDDSGIKIVEIYQHIYDKLIYIKNDKTLGPAMTRNIGLKCAHSEYILFLDCDDWIDLNCIEKATKKFEENANIDIVVWEIKTAFQHNKISSRYQYSYNNIITNTMALTLLSHTFENEYFLSPLLGCKLFKKALIDKYTILFPNTVYEDDMFTFLSFLYAEKIALITDSFLYYYQHTDSITHHFSDKYIIDFFKTFQLMYTYINESQKEFYYKYLDKSLNSLIVCMTNSITEPNIYAKYKSMIFSYFFNNINIEEYYTYSYSLTI